MNIITTKPITVQTHSFRTYGNILTDVVDALCEYIHNGYAAGLRGRASGLTKDLKVQVEFWDNTLYIKNVGVPADLQKVLNYGVENHDTPLNQFGTGFKTATSYLNPSNNGWAFYTHGEDGCFRVQAPYNSNMSIEQVENWPFEPEFASCIVVKVENEETCEELSATEAMVQKLGYHYSFAIAKGLNLQYNGVVVAPVMPIGTATTDTCPKAIHGEQVQFEYSLYTLNEEESRHAEFFPASLQGQGIYLFVNNCLATYAGTSLLVKGKDNELSKHPSMNRCVALVNILIPDDKRHLDLPFVNCKNALDWRKTNGKDYKTAINAICSEFFREARRSGEEKQLREEIAYYMGDFLSMAGAGYEEEFRVSPKGKKNECLRADAVIGFKDDTGHIPIENVTGIVEYKRDKVTSHDVGQLISYYVEMYSQVKEPERLQCMILGKKLTANAENRIAFERARGINICFKKLLRSF